MRRRHSTSVPKAMQPTYDAVVALTDAFCRDYLNEKYRELARAMAEVCAALGVGQSTAGAKARVVTDAPRTHRMDPAWMLRSFVDRNPLVWMAEADGMLVDLRDMPREVQVIAHEKGMIPYVPADQE